MRAKRSKKYRKIMESYQLAFSFHEPYQVLVDSTFLRACHRFHMPLQKFVENTLHGSCKVMVTKCTIDTINQQFETEKRKMIAAGEKRERVLSRPEFLPPPTEVPLRYCKHEDMVVGQDGWSEADCLVDLVGGMARGNEVQKNKWHYVLATADAEEVGMKRKRGQVDVRQSARIIPGVPIVYVKRSVMILEEMSGTSLGWRKGVEKDKFREGLLSGGRKRKRDDGGGSESGTEDEVSTAPINGRAMARGMKRAKAPNPLSVLPKKVKQVANKANPETEQQVSMEPKARRKRKHGSKRTQEDGQEVGAVEVS